jgi:outer membrane receptor protein involved in Fe transport
VAAPAGEATQPPVTPAAPDAPAAAAPDAPPTVAQGLAGTVLDDSGTPALGAEIKVRGSAATAITDDQGRFTLELPPGTYQVDIVYASYKTATQSLTVVEQQLTEVAVTLALDVPDEVIDISGTLDTRSAIAVLERRRKASSVSDLLSAEEISRTPDSSANDAMKRVVSVSVVDGKYVALRGLEGRYVTTILNGVQLPSTEPDRNAVPLDLFPTNLLANLTVYKSYTADLPAQFGGGTLSIETNTYPSSFEAKVGFSTSANTEATGQDGLVNPSGSGFTNFFGYDNGARGIPSLVPTDRAVRRISPAETEAIGESFSTVWSARSETTAPNFGVNATVGDTIEVGKRNLGYLASGTLRRGFSGRTGNSARTALVGGELTETDTLANATGQAEATLGALLSVGYDLTKNDQISLLGLYTHVGEDLTSTAAGFSQSDSSNVELTRISFVERALSMTQLMGSHQLDRVATGLELRWQANVATTSRDELDTRDIVYTIDTNGVRAYKDQSGSGQRYWVFLDDLSYGGGVHGRLPLARVALRAGATAQLTDRDFDGRRFRYSFVGDDPDVRALPPEQMLSAAYVGEQFAIEESTFQEDAYQASLNILAGYTSAEIEATERLRFIAGVRYERAAQDLSNGSMYAISGQIADISSTDNDVLPAANLVFQPRPDMNVRAAYSYTLARPRFRELAPFLFFDYVRRRNISGNPELVTTRIHNADARWEWFPSIEEVYAVSAFYKRFNDPIEQVLSDSESNATFDNAEGGNLIGVEFEARAGLGRLAHTLRHFRLGSNLALMRSRIELPADNLLLTSRERTMAGQSPFVVNLSVGYANPQVGEFNLLYNVIGERITDVGIQGLPDTYEQPLHRVDLVATRKLSSALKLKLTASNLLNQGVRFKQEDITVNSYDPGVSFGLGLDWTP